MTACCSEAEGSTSFLINISGLPPTPRSIVGYLAGWGMGVHWRRGAHSIECQCIVICYTHIYIGVMYYTPGPVSVDLAVSSRVAGPTGTVFDLFE